MRIGPSAIPRVRNERDPRKVIASGLCAAIAAGAPHATIVAAAPRATIVRIAIPRCARNTSRDGAEAGIAASPTRTRRLRSSRRSRNSLRAAPRSRAEGLDRQRIDKWLWHARVVRTRADAAALVAAGHVRVNGRRVDGPGRPVRAGDVLTVALDRTVRVLRVVAFAERRGSADDARVLSETLEPARSPERVRGEEA